MMNKKFFRFVPSFSRDAWLYLVNTFFAGLMFGLQYLFFNLYILKLGYNQEFIGLLASISALSTAILALPFGVLIPKFGNKRSLIAGTFLQIVAFLGWTLLPAQFTLVMASALFGAGYCLISVNAAPFMAAITTPDKRTALFSMQFSLNTLAGVVASGIGGVLPPFFAHIFGVPAEGVTTYRMILLIAMGVTVLSLVPLVLLRGERSHASSAPAFSERVTGHQRILIKLTVAQFMIALGAGILIPFVNVFYKMRFDLPDPVLGGLFAISSLAMGLSALFVPALVKRLGKIRTMILTQLLSIPFLILMGFSASFPLSAFGYLMRTALMSMNLPIFSAYAMGVVSGRLRAVTSSLLVLSWNGGWAAGSFASGHIQSKMGFSLVFLLTASLYLIASGIVYTFFHTIDDTISVEYNIYNDRRGSIPPKL